MKYVYPKLPAKRCFPFFRIAGNGLANCLFVYAKAIVSAKKYNAKLIKPTWFNLTIGPYLRHQSDKRHYLGLFDCKDEIHGFSRLVKLLFGKRYTDKNEFEKVEAGILVEEGIYDFFEPLIGHSEYVRDYIVNHVCNGLLDSVNNYDFSNCVAVHVRLGDFPENRRIPISWYESQIKLRSRGKKIIIFSDGTDEELRQLLNLDNVVRVFFGGAIQDIIAMSRCEYIIGSDSSFSAWGAYLGQVPCCFYKLQFGNVLVEKSMQIIENK